MNNTTVIKYFIHNDTVYELVYKVEESFSKSLPDKIKKEFEAKIQKTIHDEIKNLKIKIQQIEYDDCTDVGRATGTIVSELENSLNDSLKKATVKSAEVFYKHITSKPSASPLTGTVLITPAGEHEETLDDYISGMGERLLIGDIKNEFDELDDPYEKLELINSELNKITKSEEKERILTILVEDFNNYLKNPPSLVEMSPKIWAQHLEIFGSLLSPKSQSFINTWQYLHPILKQNLELRENIKVFSQEFLGNKLLEQTVENDLADLKKSVKDQEDENDISFEMVCENRPQEIIDTRLAFLQNLDAFISKGIHPQTEGSWIFFDGLQKRDFEDQTWIKTNDQLNQLATADREIDRLEEAELKRLIASGIKNLQRDLISGLALSIKYTSPEIPPTELPLESSEDFLEFIKDLSLKQQLKIIHFLQNDVLKAFETIRFKDDSEDAKIQHLKKNITIVKTDTEELHAFLDLEYIPYREKNHKREFSDVIRKRYSFEITEDKNIEGFFRQESISAKFYYPLRAFLSLESLSGRIATPKTINLI